MTTSPRPPSRSSTPRRLARLGLALSLTTGLALSPVHAGNPRPRPAGPTIEVPGELVLTSLTHGATVEIDGKQVGVVPLDQSITLLPGKHTIRLQKRGFSTMTRDFQLAPGDTVELEIDLIAFAGILTITSTPANATVRVDGKVLGVTPLDVDVAAGLKVFQVGLDGYLEETRQVDVRAAAPLALDFRLKPIAVASDKAFYETWWFWTIVGVAGAGTAAAVLATSGGETTPTADFALRIP